jgi:uncharacterized protein (TIGR03545 family)
MRKKFVYYVLIPLALFLIISYIFIDRWVATGMEYAGERIVGARVEIDNLKLSFSPLGIRFARLQVANAQDPWKNLFETGPVRFSMDFGQLLRGKYIIETMEINDIILGTKRTTDGSIPGARPTTQQTGGEQPFAEVTRQVLEKTVEKTPIFDPALLRKGVDVDSLVKAQHFQTLSLIDSLRQRTNSASQQWDSTVASFETGKKRLQEIELNIKGINPSELNSVDKITSAISTVDNARKTIDDVTKTFQERKSALQGNVQNLTAAVATIDESVKKDYQKVLGLARLPDLNTMGLAELILGKQLLTDAQKYAHYLDLARAQMDKFKSKPDIESPPRMRGQNILFPVERGYPKFWIKNITVSGGTDRTQDPEFIYLKGEVKNVSSDQKIAGEPLSVRLDGSKGESMSLGFAGTIDRRKEMALDEYKAHVTGIKLAAFELGKSDFLPSKIVNASLNTDVTVTVPGSSFDAGATFDFRNMSLEFMVEPRNLGERLARQVLSAVQGFNAGLRLWKKDGNVDVAFSTDLDNQFVGNLKAALGAEFARLQNDIRGKVEGVIAEKRKEFESLFAQKRADLQKQLDGYQSLIAEKTGVVDTKKKELQGRLEKVKSGAIDNLMKGIFKK